MIRIEAYQDWRGAWLYALMLGHRTIQDGYTSRAAAESRQRPVIASRYA